MNTPQKTLLKTDIYQDGKLIKSIEGEDSSNKAFAALLRLQGQSTDYALKFGGWKVIEHFNDGTEENWKPYTK